MRTILIASSNSGKLRDFAAAATDHNVLVAPVPGIDKLPPPREDAPTFVANACKKAEHYSRHVKNQFVLADDSGLVVEVLGGAPGVRSARYAAESEDENASDAANNARLLKELTGVSQEHRTAKFVCSIAVARNGRLEACFRAEVQGVILESPRGDSGFGYDPLFFYPPLKTAFGELSAEEKARVSHRGQAFRKFLAWFSSLSDENVQSSQTSVTKQLAVRRE